MLTLAVAEINYNPVDPMVEFGESEDANGGDFEFIELVNTGNSAINLSGYELIRVGDEGVDFTFPSRTIAPDERVVVVEDAVNFRSRYGTDVPVVGEWSGGLSNDSEQITLVRNGVLVEQFIYKSNNNWPTRADGLGASLERKDFVSDDMSDPDVWRSSIEYGGSPGEASGSRIPDVIINEILAHTDLPQRDLVELHNTTDAPINISGWYLTDNIVDRTMAFAVPNGTVIPAQGYVSFTEDDFNPGDGTLDTDFAFSERGEPTPQNDDPEQGGVWLLEAAGNGRPQRFADRVTFGATENGVTVGNVLNVDVSSKLQQLAEWTRNAANGDHRIGDIIISEVQHHSPVDDQFGDDDVLKEYIELYNPHDVTIDISGWQIEDAVDITFSPGTLIRPGESLVVVAFNPGLGDQAAAFRSYYGITDSVPLFGPWGVDGDGRLDRLSNGGETVTLTKPEPDMNEDGSITILQIAIDQVDYDDDEPWPEVADGDGGSIERTAFDAFGNFATSWEGVTPTPGNQPLDPSSNPLLPLDTPVGGNVGLDGEVVRGLADVDLYRFTPATSGVYDVTANGGDAGGATPYLRVFETDGSEIASGASDASQSVALAVNLEAGTEYWIGVNGNSFVLDEAGQPINVAGSYDPVTGKGITAATVTNPATYVGDYEILIEQATTAPPWQNPINPLDVNNNGSVEPLDALVIINRINDDLGGPLPEPSDDAPPPFLDVNGDGSLSPIDALQIINFLNDDSPVAAVAATPDVGMLLGHKIVIESSSQPVQVVSDTSPEPMAVDLALQDYDVPTHDQLDEVKSAELPQLDVDAPKTI